MDYSRVLGALAAVLGLIFLLRWCSRFLFTTAVGRRASRAVEVLARAPVSPKQQIMLIRVGRRVIVVGDSGAQMNSLCEVSDPDEVAALVGQLQDERLAPAARAFGAMFGRSRRPFESSDESATDATLIDEPDETQTVASARDEISGLRDRVRLLAQQFKGT
jgi:flagellar biogenesis protein FliO